MAYLGRDGRFDPFNPLNNQRHRNPPTRAEPEQPPTLGPNPFARINRANRLAGTNPPFVFNPRPQRPRWNFGADGQWGLNMNTQRRPIRAAAYDADQGYARFQARAFGLPQARPAPAPVAPPVPDVPGVAPPPVDGAAPLVPPPAPEGGAQPDQTQAADPPVILLGPSGNAGTGRELDVPPAIILYNLGRDLLGYVRAMGTAVAGFISSIWLAVTEVAGPLLHFVTQWAIFLISVAFTVWASIPIVVRTLVAAHRYVAMLLASLLEALGWAFGLNIQWPRGNAVSYTLRPEYTSRAVTDMAYMLEPGVCPIGDGIRGPPYGASALSSTDFMLPYPFSLPPIRIVWTTLWTLLMAPVAAVVWALAAALAIDLQIWPDEDDDRHDQ